MDLELGRPSVERRPAVPAVPKVAIVIPTLNERENITVLVERVARALDCISWEAIFVDDDSADGTIDAVRRTAGTPGSVASDEYLGEAWQAPYWRACFRPLQNLSR
jgi:hypothetical protein